MNASYYKNKASGFQIRVSDISVTSVGDRYFFEWNHGVYPQLQPLENWEPSSREEFCKEFDRLIIKLESLEKEIDLEENNEMAAAVVIRRAN